MVSLRHLCVCNPTAGRQAARDNIPTSMSCIAALRALGRCTLQHSGSRHLLRHRSAELHPSLDSCMDPPSSTDEVEGERGPLGCGRTWAGGVDGHPIVPMLLSLLLVCCFRSCWHKQEGNTPVVAAWRQHETPMQALPSCSSPAACHNEMGHQIEAIISTAYLFCVLA